MSDGREQDPQAGSVDAGRELDDPEVADTDEGSDDDLVEDRVGHLVDPDAGSLLDLEADAVATATDEYDDLSPEEQAIHLTRDPRMGELGDGYLDGASEG